jgi:hypothetical protein
MAAQEESMQQSDSDKYDSPWKEGLDHYFQQFMAFFFPGAHTEIDWERGYESLEEELRQVVRDSEVSDRRADKLIKVWLRSGEERYVLIHIEILADRDAGFPERMFVYNYRTFDRYHKVVVSLAVLGDDSRSWRPDRYGWKLWGCQMSLRFPVVKLIDYKERWSELAESANPFAIVVMSHLKTKETHGDPSSRLLWKTKLVRMLYERGLQRQDVLELFRLIDWMMVLPEAEDLSFQEDLRKFEAEVKMPYVTSIERRGIEKGKQEGMQQGMQQGLQQGEAKVLVHLIERKFGELPDTYRRQISEADEEIILLWSDRLLTAQTLEQIFGGGTDPS